MSGDGFKFTQKRLQEVFQTEFLVTDSMLKQHGIERAEEALEIYADVADFLKKTGWEKDNPECSSEEYLTENRICRWADGMLLYFSWIVWEGYTQLEKEKELIY